MDVIDIDSAFNLIIENRARHLSLRLFSDMLDRFLWLLDVDVIQVSERWVCSDDKVKVEIVLGVREFFPFREMPEMVAALTRVAQRWPELKSMCDEMVLSRSQQLVQFSSDDKG